MNSKRLVLLVCLVGIASAYFFAGGDQLLNPRIYQEQFEQSPVRSVIVFFIIFLCGTALSLPVCGVLSVTCGFLFGHLIGLPLALIACALGGTIAYLVSRYLLGDFVQKRFAGQLTIVNRGMEAEGSFYVFALRMVPIVPFWLLNLVLGLTPIRPGAFLVATFFGMLPITLILVHFGTQLSSVANVSVAEIFTPGLILSLALLTSMPFLARIVVNWIRHNVIDKGPR